MLIYESLEIIQDLGIKGQLCGMIKWLSVGCGMVTGREKNTYSKVLAF